MPNAHGTKKAYEVDKCKCDICVAAQRKRWAAKDERRANRNTEPQPEPVAMRPALRVVKQDEAQPEPGRTGLSIEMPRLWSINADEPEYAEGHRQALADAMLSILKDPANEYHSLVMTDGTKQEAKDFHQLLDTFKRANPALMTFAASAEHFKGFPGFGYYYGFTIWSPEFVYPEDDEDDEDDEQAPEPRAAVPPWLPWLPVVGPSGPLTEPARAPEGTTSPRVQTNRPRTAASPPERAAERPGQPWEQPAAHVAARRTRTPSGPAQPRMAAMGRAPTVPGSGVRSNASGYTYELRRNSHWMCEAKLSIDKAYCSRAVGQANEWKYRVAGRPVCQDHYNAVRIIHPDGCEYRSNGIWIPAPRN
jgi:hypothetical protein